MDFYGTQNFRLNQAKNMVVHRGNAFPSPHLVGQMFYRLDLDKLYVCNTTAYGDDNDWYDLTQRVSAGIPQMVALWMGSSGYSGYTDGLETIPAGYVKCDGTLGTVNTLNKFIKVASTSAEVIDGVSHGSNAAHTHTGMGGNHTHTFTTTFNWNNRWAHDRQDTATGADAHHGHNVTYVSTVGNAGGTTSSTSIPAHSTVIYIMKT